MLDQAKSSANPQRTPTRGALAPTEAHPEAPPSPLPEGQARTTDTDEPLYSIRVAENPGTTCAACGKQKTGAGPVGYMDDEPICDLCLLERSSDLGMILALIAVVRAYAEACAASEHHYEALAELPSPSSVLSPASTTSSPLNHGRPERSGFQVSRARRYHALRAGT